MDEGCSSQLRDDITLICASAHEKKSKVSPPTDHSKEDQILYVEFEPGDPSDPSNFSQRWVWLRPRQ